MLYSVGVEFDLRRIVIAEGKQVNAAGADVAHRERRIAKEFALNVEIPLHLVRRLLDVVHRAEGQ